MMDTSYSYFGLQSELVKLLYENKGLDGLSFKLSEFLNCCSVIFDVNGTQLSISISPKIDTEQKMILQQTIAVQDSCTVSGLYRLTLPLGFDGKNSGTLSVSRFDTPFSEADRQILQCAAGLICVQLAQDKKVADIELRLKGNFVEDLVFMHYSDPESIMSRARSLNYNVSAVHRVLVAEIESLQQVILHFGNDQEAAIVFKTAFVHSIQNCLDKTHKGMVMYSKETFILLVQDTAGGDMSDIKVLAEKIIEDAALQYRAKLYIGIGSRTSGLSDFSKSYIEAKKALDIGEYMITEGQVRSFEKFRVHALFLSTLKPAELYNYARDQLDALLSYDEKHNTDFLKTLQEFLYLRNNVEGTAKSLNMSVSGLKYRLKKIERLIGQDLKDYKVSFDLQLALVILQLFGEYRIKDI